MRHRRTLDVDAALEKRGPDAAADQPALHGAGGTGNDPEATLLAGESRELLRVALMALPVAQREVVVLRYFGNLTLEEVSATVGAGVETVRSRLRYAYKALRTRLEAGA